jgi:hypothetical protein
MIKRNFGYAWQILSLSTLCLALAPLTARDPGNYCSDYYFGDELPCFENCHEPRFETGIDFLYFKPVIDDLEYVFKSKDGFENSTSVEATGEGKYKFIDLDNQPAFRVHACKPRTFFGFNFSSSYTYLRAKDRNSTSIDEEPEALLLPTLLHGGFLIPDITEAEGTWKLCYQSADLLIGYDFTCANCHQFTPFVGFEWLRIDQTIHAKYASNPAGLTASTKWHGEYNGAGLKAGIGYWFTCSQCLSLYAKGFFSILTGDVDSNYHIQQQLSISEITDLHLKAEDCLFVPGYHISIGVSYGTRFCGWKLRWNLGYEFVEWSHVPNLSKFYDDNILLGINSSSNTSTLGLHGFSWGGTISY